MGGQIADCDYISVPSRLGSDPIANWPRCLPKDLSARSEDGRYGANGQYTIVKDYVRERRRQSREMFVPLSHPPGHAQCDFG